MTEIRNVSMTVIKDLCAVGSIEMAHAVNTGDGWRIMFRIGKGNSYSLASIRAARGGERVYKSLDSAHDMLCKVGCKSLDVVISHDFKHVRNEEKPLKPTHGNPTKNPEIERYYVLQEKQRATFLTKAERDEFKYLKSKYELQKLASYG